MAKLKKHFEIKNQGGIAKINILGAISWWRNNSDEFTQLVDGLLEDGVQDVDAYINSVGGVMVIGGELRNQFARFPGRKKVKLGAICASAATSLTTVFDEIEVSPNISYMIHDPIHEGRMEHEEDFDSAKKLYVNLRNQAIKDYVSLTQRIKGDDGGLSESEISDMMRKTTWMSAAELIEKGFAHKISGEEDSYLPEDSLDIANSMRFQLPVNLVDQIESLQPDDDEGQPSDPPTPQLQNQSKMKNLLLTFLASVGVTNFSGDSSDQDIFNGLKQFVDRKVQAFNNLVNALKGIEGIDISNDAGHADIALAIQNAIKAKGDTIAQLQADLDKIDNEKRQAVFDLARNQKGFTDKQIENLKNMAKTSSIEAVVNFLEDVPDKKSASGVVQNSGGSTGGSMAHAINSRLAGIKAKLNS